MYWHWIHWDLLGRYDWEQKHVCDTGFSSNPKLPNVGSRIQLFGKIYIIFNPAWTVCAAASLG